MNSVSTREIGENGLYACPCCGYATLQNVSAYEVCELCYWEDDGQDDPNESENRNASNKVSLAEARVNFFSLGVCDVRHLDHVRPIESTDVNVRHYVFVDGCVTRRGSTKN